MNFDLLWLFFKKRLCLSGVILTQATDIGTLLKLASINGNNFLNV